MSQKTTSLLIILIMYIAAVFIGVVTFLNLNVESIFLKVFIADLSATIFIYLAGLIFKNSSLYDPYWSVIPPMITILISIYFGVFFHTPILLLNLAILIWAIRLTYNWMLTWTGFDYIDWRYVMIKEKTPKIWLLTNFLAIHFFPTVIVFIQLIGTIYYINGAQTINYITVLAFIVIVIAASIQLIADKQMRDFKENKVNQRKIINVGLWKYSRHPNYFGEVLMWFGVYLFYFSYTLKIDYIILMPIIMLAMFIFISIPMMEKKILKTRPEYEEYQKNVSMLLILPNKQSKIVEKYE